MPLLSIITVCKNPGFSIAETVNSVVTQSFKDMNTLLLTIKLRWNYRIFAKLT